MMHKLTSRGFGVLAAGLALVACEPDIPPPFDIEEQGGIEALLFFDADENQVFDPSAGDYALPGVQVRITVRGDTTQVLDVATSDAQGRFVVQGLPAGTHDAYIVPSTIPDDVVLCTNPVPVTVNPDEVRFFRLEARAGCLILIEAAEALPEGSEVVVRGIVTSFPGQIRGGYTYIQDGSGGIRLFSSSLEGQGIEIGDRIEVSGTVAQFNQDLQISGVALRAIEPDFDTPFVNPVTTAEISAAAPIPADPLQGTLVRVEGAELTTEFGEGGLNALNAVLNDGSGPVEIRVEGGVADSDDLNTIFTAGACYNVTGVVGNFRGTGQIFPRSLEDVEEVPCS